MSDKYVIVCPGIGVYCKDGVFRWTKSAQKHEVYPDRASAERERLRLHETVVWAEIRAAGTPPSEEAAHALQAVTRKDLDIVTQAHVLGLSPDEFDALVGHESN